MLFLIKFMKLSCHIQIYIFLRYVGTLYEHNIKNCILSSDFRDSKMFDKVPENIVNILSKEDSTVNYHHFCITDEVG